MRSTLYKAADELLRLKQGKGLSEWLHDHREMSLRVMARQLWVDTDEAIDVSHETLRAWKDEQEAAA